MIGKSKACYSIGLWYFHVSPLLSSIATTYSPDHEHKEPLDQSTLINLNLSSRVHHFIGAWLFFVLHGHSMLMPTGNVAKRQKMNDKKGLSPIFGSGNKIFVGFVETFTGMVKVFSVGNRWDLIHPTPRISHKA